MRASTAALGVAFLLIVVKAASADLTWDESWTFLHYGRPLLGFARLDYANDHVLNSILVHWSTRLFGPSVFAIRLPNVLAALLYLGSVAVVMRHVEARGLAFAILVLDPYLLEHFALARGYGIAAALLGSALAWFVFAEADWRRGFAPLLALTLVASFAIGSDVTILAGFVASRAILASREREGPSWIGASAVALILAVVPLLILLHETRPGVPVFGSASGPFDAIAAGTARMFVPDRFAGTLAAVAIVALALGLVACRRQVSSRTAFLLLATAAELVLVEAGSLLFGKLLPTGRLLVPSLPLWGAALVSLADDSGAGRSLAGSSATVAVTAALALSFACRWHADRFGDWPEDAGLEARLARAVAAHPTCLPWDVWSRYGHEYYLDRWFRGRGGPPDVACSRPP